MNLMEVKGLRKTFAERVLFEIPELQLLRGQSYMLSGANGVGKSTLLKVLAGLEPAQIQSVAFEGLSLPPNEICVRLAPRVIYLHQHPYLFDSSVAANIAFGLRMNGGGMHERTKLVREAMEWAGVAALADIPPRKLSGGEKQRVALARAKVLNPKLLLLDEPTANLDEQARQQVAALINQLCDDNHCVVVATHDREMLRLENSISLHLDKGKITPG